MRCDAQFAEAALIPHCHKLWCRPAAAAPNWPLAWEQLAYAPSAALKKKKKKKVNQHIKSKFCLCLQEELYRISGPPKTFLSWGHSLPHQYMTHLVGPGFSFSFAPKFWFFSPRDLSHTPIPSSINLMLNPPSGFKDLIFNYRLYLLKKSLFTEE